MRATAAGRRVWLLGGEARGEPGRMHVSAILRKLGLRSRQELF